MNNTDYRIAYLEHLVHELALLCEQLALAIAELRRDVPDTVVIRPDDCPAMFGVVERDGH